MKKLFSTVILAASVLVSSLSSAQDGFEFSANAALTNDYKFYGFSQSDEGWAIQGGFDISHESGFYLGTWASTVDFDLASTEPASIELDVYGGYASELSNGLAYDLGVIRYGYPNQNDDIAVGGDLEYYEFYANFEYGFGGDWEPTLSAGIAISPDWFGESGTSIYPNGGLSITLPQEFGAYFNIGYLDVDDINYNYFHYQVGVTKDFAGLSFDLSYADADDDCDGGTGDYCTGFIFSVSKEF